jgi:hypothetical protein
VKAGMKTEFRVLPIKELLNQCDMRSDPLLGEQFVPQRQLTSLNLIIFLFKLELS